MCELHNYKGYCPLCSKRNAIEKQLGKMAAKAFDAGYNREYIKLNSANMKIAYDIGRGLSK